MKERSACQPCSRRVKRTCARELTVSKGDDFARSFGLCHSPDIFYSIGLALAGLSTEVVREVPVLSD